MCYTGIVEKNATEGYGVFTAKAKGDFYGTTFAFGCDILLTSRQPTIEFDDLLPGSIYGKSKPRLAFDHFAEFPQPFAL